MTKKQWQELYRILNDIHSNFVIDYQTYRNGKNKKIRSDTERKIFNAIHLADYHVKKILKYMNFLLGDQKLLIMAEQ